MHGVDGLGSGHLRSLKRLPDQSLSYASHPRTLSCVQKIGPRMVSVDWALGKSQFESAKKGTELAAGPGMDSDLESDGKQFLYQS
jgi:hypothetical protein